MEVNPEEPQRPDIGYKDNQPTFPFSINKLILHAFENTIGFSVSLHISIGFYTTFPSANWSQGQTIFNYEIDN